MNRSVVLLSITSFILALILSPGAPVDAADGVGLVESKAEHVFAQQITFTLRATSDVEIEAVFLFFRATGDEQTRSVEIPVDAAREINVSYVHNLRVFPLPPFADVEFWWRLKDGAGTEWAIPSEYHEYADDRFAWDHLGDDRLAVHWIHGSGDSVFGQAALDVARSSLEQIGADLQTALPEPVDLYIYDAQHNLDAAMMLSGREWVVGQAHPELGVILAAIPDEPGYTSQMQRIIPHEMTHLVLYQFVTPSGYPHVPEWLDEGLATDNEWLPTPEYARALEEARVTGELLPLEDLCVSFPPDVFTTRLAYAESGSLVRFIREERGAQGIRDLLRAYAGGASCSSGVQDGLQISLDRLELEWQASLEPQAGWRAWIDRAAAWVGLSLLSVLVALPMVGSLRRR